MNRTRSRVALIASLLLALIATPLGGVAAPEPGADGAAHAPLAAPARQQLHWLPCADLPDTQCAGLAVPVDPANPEGAQLILRLGRVPAADPANAKGALLMIPGGPGFGIADVFGAHRARFHISELQRRYDVVTFDPRGVGQSSPIRCAADAVPVPPVDGVASQAEFAALARAHAAFARSCFEASGELMAHLSAMDTAADIEQIRQAVGQDDGLVAWSASYGTNFSGAYLERYGDRVKALVLDSVFDHSVDLPTMLARNAQGVEQSFGRFAAWCDADADCALHGRNVRSAFDAVAAAHPGTRSLVGGLLALGRDPELGWPALARVLAQAADGDAAALVALSGTVDTMNPAVASGRAGLFRGVLCADFGPQADHEPLGALGAVVAAESPRFGAWKYWEQAGGCVGWPAMAPNPPHRLRVGSHPNVLVANNRYDPQTPLVGALAVWAQIPEARLLTAEADGHGVLYGVPGSRCAFDAQVRFLDAPDSVPRFTACAD